MDIAIVGAGISGSNVLKSLITHPNFQADDKIDVFEPRQSLGSGLPYEPTDDESIMLNTSSEVLSVDEENELDFTEWLERHFIEPTNFENLVSRPRYGKYLVERFAPYYSHEQVCHVQSSVVDVEVLDAETKEPAADTQDGNFVYRIKTVDGWQDTIYDAVFFSVGHPEYNDFYDLKGFDHYIHNPYPMKEKLSNLDNNQKISIIGSGATGVDLMRFFTTNYELEQPLTFYDLNEPFHCVAIPYDKNGITYRMTKDWIEDQKEEHGGFIPLEVMLETIKEDLKQENADPMTVYNRYESGTLEVFRKAFDTKDQELAAVQKYAATSVPYLPHLYNALSGEDQQEYMKNYHSIMLFFKAKVPYYSYQWLFELIDAGKVETVAGLEEVTILDSGRFQFVTKDRKDEADIVVNATGFINHIETLTNYSELIKNLFHRRLIMPHVNGKFILVDWPQCRVINQQFGRMDNLFFLGLLIGGTQHENNDAGQTIQQARYTAKAFMDGR